jgi:hypothetical protein
MTRNEYTRIQNPATGKTVNLKPKSNRRSARIPRMKTFDFPPAFYKITNAAFTGFILYLFLCFIAKYILKK